jgi:4-hydroxy-tetrahydrodipicolinate synthase
MRREHKMANLRNWDGIYPAACVIFKDKNCREIDEEACRQHVSNLLSQKGIAGIFVSSAHEGLSMEERVKVLKIAVEEAKGKLPVVGGVWADFTWMVIEQGKINKEAGADALYFLPPTITAYDPMDDELLVEHAKKFDKEVGLPFFFYGSPMVRSPHTVLPKTFKKLSVAAKNLVAWKIPSLYHLGVFRECLNALRAAENETGRHVAALLAGDHGLLEALKNGGEGNVNGGGVYRVKEDVEIFEAVKKGDLIKAYAIQDRMQPITDAIRGDLVGKGHVHFPYRYKVAAWLLGKIPRPYIRRPLMPISKEEVAFLRDALIQSGMKPVREPEEIEASEM